MQLTTNTEEDEGAQSVTDTHEHMTPEETHEHMPFDATLAAQELFGYRLGVSDSAWVEAGGESLTEWPSTNGGWLEAGCESLTAWASTQVALLATVAGSSAKLLPSKGSCWSLATLAGQ